MFILKKSEYGAKISAANNISKKYSFNSGTCTKLYTESDSAKLPGHPSRGINWGMSGQAQLVTILLIINL